MDKIYTMWDYARNNAQDDKNRHESLADDLDAAFGRGNWRISRNMDENPADGERAIVFTYADGDTEGDFQIFARGEPKLSVVVSISGEIVAICASARQALHISSLETAITGDPHRVDCIAMEKPKTRLAIAREYVDGQRENAEKILCTDILDEAEKATLRAEI